MAVIEIRDDERGYREWVARNSDGFVLNIPRSLNPSTARLHRATCPTVNGTPARGTTRTGAYIKVCSTSLRELEEWAQRNAGPVERCGTCHP